MYSKQKSSYNKIYKHSHNNRPKSAMIISDKVKFCKVRTVDSVKKDKRETQSYFAYLDVDSDLEEGEERDELEEVEEVDDIDEISEISEISEMSEVDDDEISTNNNLAKPETREERGLRMSKMKHWADYSDDEE